MTPGRLWQASASSRMRSSARAGSSSCLRGVREGPDLDERLPHQPLRRAFPLAAAPRAPLRAASAARAGVP